MDSLVYALVEIYCDVVVEMMRVGRRCHNRRGENSHQQTRQYQQIFHNRIYFINYTKLVQKHQWFSGKIRRCHRRAPSSILGWCTFCTCD